MTCPNVNLPSWIKLNELIPDVSYYVWNKLEGNIDDNGHPTNDSEIFTNMLDKNNGDYKATYLEFLTSSNLNEEVNYQYKSKASDIGVIAAENTIRDIASRLADRIGYNVRFESDRTKDYKGKLEGNTAYVNLAHATLDTPIHELLGHPIIRQLKITNSTLYSNLLKELEEGEGKKVLDRIKSNYQYKGKVYQTEDGKWTGISDIDPEKSFGYYGIKERAEDALPKYTLEEQQEEALVELLGLMTAEKLDAVKDGKLISLLKRLLKEIKAFVKELLKQREVEIDKLPDNMTLGDLSDLLAYSNSKIILPGYKVEYTTPDNNKFNTYGEASKHISDLTKNIKDIDLDNIKVENKSITGKIDPITGKKIKNAKFIKGDDPEWSPDENVTLPGTPDIFELQFEDGSSNSVYDEDLFRNYDEEVNQFYSQIKPFENTIEKFIEKNKEYEQSKEIIEEWKKVNNIQYNPEEIYSRGQGFYSVVGAYSNFDVKLMFQNLLAHIEDNQKAGGEFIISAFTKPIDRTISHLEGDGSKIKFVIYPKSEDIKWAANTDVYSGSVWDASEKVNKDKKSELLGVSYTKYPSLASINNVKPNLAEIIDNLAHQHNELGIALNNNFRLEYDDNTPYDIKKLIDNINSILDQKFGKLVKPKISPYSKAEFSPIDEKLSVLTLNEFDNLPVKSTIEDQDNEFLDIKNEIKIYNGKRYKVQIIEGDRSTVVYESPYENIGSPIQPTQTHKNLKENITSISNRIKQSTYYFLANELDSGKWGIQTEDGDFENIFDTKEEAEKELERLQPTVKEKEYTSQALINTKIDRLKSVAKKYPRALIRSEVKSLEKRQRDLQNELFELEELPFQKVSKDKYVYFPGHEKYYDENGNPKKEELINEQEVNDVEQSEPELTQSEKTLTDSLSKLDRLGELKEKAIKALQVKLQVIQQRKHLNDTDIKRAEEFIKTLSGLESEQALIEFTKQANKVVGRYYKEYLKVKQQLKDIKDGASKLDKKDVFNPKLLHRWRDYLSAYNVVDEFQSQLLKEGKLEGNQEIKNIISNVIEKKRMIRELYEVEGLDMAADFLSYYYDKIYVDNKILASKKYEELDEEQKKKMSKQEFIRVQKEVHDQDIHEQTVLQLRQELKKANRDISSIGRWVDTVADSLDAPITAAYKAMSVASFRTNHSVIKTRDDLVDHLRQLEEYLGNPSNKKVLYDFMLEKGPDGKYNTRIVNRFGGEFWSDYSNFLNELEEQEVTGDEYIQKVRQWKRKNAPLKVESFRKAKWEFINELKEKGLITLEEMEAINANDISYNPMTEQEMAEYGDISETVADELSAWTNANVWDYREPSDHYKEKNPQWNKLKSILDNRDDPRAQFYHYFIDTLEEYNNMLPYHQRLTKFQLPSVLKTSSEQFADKESIKDIAKTVLAKQFDVLANDLDRTEQTITDEEGNIRHFIPVYYTGALKRYIIKSKDGVQVKETKSKLEAERYINSKSNKGKGYVIEVRNAPEDQSYDLSTLLLKFGAMAADYSNKAEIFPEMELTKFFINTREVANTDSKGNPIKNLLSKFSKDNQTVKAKNETNLAAFFNDWYEMAMYGMKRNKEGSIFGLDVAKTVDLLNKFTSLNLLALNVRAGLNNVVLGDAMQLAEAFAKEHMDLKSYNKAHWLYTRNIPGLMADAGSRKSSNFINRLYEHFNLPTESLNQNLKDNTRFKMLGKKSSLFFIMHAGDFYMQSRLFLGMLENIRAYDKDGKDIGSMLDMYQKHFNETKQIGLPKDKEGKDIVDVTKSNWKQKDIDNFTIKTRGILAGIHGEYGELERNAIQKSSLGLMAIAFRKFIVPGIRKRYKKYNYSERVGDYTEGYYRSFAKFMMNLSKELATLHFALIKDDWNNLSPHQKANVIRAFSEVAFLTAAIILAGVLLGKAKDGDDDKKFLYSWGAYQMLRFKSELLFFTPKIDEAMTILRSPMASMSIFENLTNTTHQLSIDVFRIINGDGPEKYVRGSHKGDYKMSKIMYDWIPVARSIYQFLNTKEQLNLMNQSMVHKR